ncbi:MAG TPA: hypothetical protein ENH10_08280, partial [Bacteroidetes bacterium]|nr:hypothetical protein [Bacteroidota bacterium]HEX05132.1 hypothetical protein [Bacteroidota bacterium]
MRTQQMNWIHSLLRENKDDDGPSEDLQDLRDRFDSFRELVEKNNEVLSLIGDMEEKAQGEYLFDIAYIRGCVSRLQDGVSTIVRLMIEQGGEEYETLRIRFTSITGQINNLLPGSDNQQGGPLILNFERINRVNSQSVGGKNAQLGEMRSMGLSVPEGFAITASAFRLFLDENQLNKRIQDTLSSLDIRNQNDLVAASETLRSLILSSPIPQVLSDSILAAFDELRQRTGDEFIALRSSAVGEDTLYSFAGQYISLLNVSRDSILDNYREILASKYSPRAIYYFLSHSLEEAGLLMSVGCIQLVNASVAGVIYSCDPLDSESDNILVNAVYGLGPYLVGGVLTPDVYKMHSASYEVTERLIHDKSVMLCPGDNGGTVERPVPEDLRRQPCLNDTQLAELGALASQLEEHYESPQDIEFAYDQDGRLFLLQSRPLRTVSTQTTLELPDMSDVTQLANGGVTVCPGAGSGRVIHVSGRDSLQDVEHGDVIVAANPFPSIVRVLDRVSAVVTEVGSCASHMAALVRENRIPTLAGLS